MDNIISNSLNGSFFQNILSNVLLFYFFTILEKKKKKKKKTPTILSLMATQFQARVTYWACDIFSDNGLIP